MRAPLAAFLLVLPVQVLPGQRWVPQESITRAEFRGLHAVDARIVWAAGRGGVVAHTDDGGAHWRVDTIPGAEQLFLIAVHALDARRAWVAGTAFQGASLGRIYATSDGGASWQLQYQNDAKGLFFDGMRFWDARRGLAFSDPIDGKLFLVTSEDGGAHWVPVAAAALPVMLPSEAAFAASGTAITLGGSGEVWIATGGGPRARVLHSADGGRSWEAFDTPATGGSAKGLFGIAIGPAGRAVAVGGDYQRADSSFENLLLSDDAGRTWRVASSPGLLGVQYGVAYAGGDRFLAAGPGGSALSRDRGTSWTRLDGPGFNTVACADGVCWGAGVGGRIARLALGSP